MRGPSLAVAAVLFVNLSLFSHQGVFLVGIFFLGVNNIFIIYLYVLNVFINDKLYISNIISLSSIIQ